MQEKTREKQAELIDALQELGVSVTRFELTEYIRGDPTDENAKPTGAEIELTAYLSFGKIESNDENPFKVK